MRLEIDLIRHVNVLIIIPGSTCVLSVLQPGEGAESGEGTQLNHISLLLIKLITRGIEGK